MTEIVIDSSVLAKFLLKEEGWEKVIGILHRRPCTLDLARAIVNIVKDGMVVLEKLPKRFQDRVVERSK